MSGGRRQGDPGPNGQTGSRWSLLLPWGVLPLALAIITLADWLQSRRRRQSRKEAA